MTSYKKRFYLDSDFLKQLYDELEKYENIEAEEKAVANKIRHNIRKLNQMVHRKGYLNAKIIKKAIKKATTSLRGGYSSEIKFFENLKYRGRDIIQIQINPTKALTLEKVGRIASRLSRKLNEKNILGKISSSIVYGRLGWKSGKFGTIGNDVDIYDPAKLYDVDEEEEYEGIEPPKNIKEFMLYLALKPNENQGGSDDKFNDCFYYSLKYFVFNLDEYYKSPCQMKQELGLKRCDRIPVKCIDIVEAKINKKEKLKINIRGDSIRSSTIDTNSEANIQLINGHYQPEKLNKRFKLLTYGEEKTFVLYSKKDLIAYDGVKKWKIDQYDPVKDKSHIYVLRTQYKGKDFTTEEVFDDIQFKKVSITKYKGKEFTIEEEYGYLVEVADELKKHSKGLINLYKCGSYFNACLSLFDFLTKHIQAEPILQDEAEWISYSGFGSMIWSEKGTYEKLYKLDVKSLFPFIYISHIAKLPIKRGEFLNIDELDEFIKFGIYRAEVIPSKDEQYNKLFKFSKYNYYTSVDLQNAQKLGFEIKLIKDDKPNFLYYSRDKLVTFKELFKKFTDILFPLKELGVKQSKFILNLLWGALCQIDKKKHYVTDGFKIDDDDEIIGIKPSSINKGEIIISTAKMNARYKTNFARVKPFMLSNGRKIMSSFMKPYINNIKRVICDSIETIEPIHFNTDVKIGELKYEGVCFNATIANNYNKIEYKYI